MDCILEAIGAFVVLVLLLIFIAARRFLFKILKCETMFEYVEVLATPAAFSFTLCFFAVLTFVHKSRDKERARDHEYRMAELKMPLSED